MLFATIFVSVAFLAYNLEALQIGSIYMLSNDKAFPTGNIETVSMVGSLCDCKRKCLEMADCRGVMCTENYDGYIAKMFTSADVSLIFTEKTRSFCKIHGKCFIEEDQIDRGIELGYVRLFDAAYGKPGVSMSVYKESTTYEADKAVDGNDATFFHSKNQNAKEWISFDLGKSFLVREIKIVGREAWTGRFGDFKVYLSNEFDPNANFATYPEILEVVGRATSISKTYKCSALISGRFFTLARQTNGIFEAQTIEVLAIV